MNQAANWRTQVNAEDYFGQQKKQLQVADRRPVIRKPSDLVGPGIAANAVRITDFNDGLATYNGFFSALGNAYNAPADADASDELVGYITSDGEFGGEQVFTRLSDGFVFRRVFIRAPYDPETITWGTWNSVPVPDPLEGVWQNITLLNSWVNYGSGEATAQYMKKDGIVYTKGAIKNGVSATMFTFPVGYRPAENRSFAGTALVTTGAASAGTAHTHGVSWVGIRQQVSSTGSVVNQNTVAATGFISLDSIIFPAEA